MIEVRVSRRLGNTITVRAEIGSNGDVVEISDYNARMVIAQDIPALERLRDALTVAINEVKRG